MKKGNKVAKVTLAAAMAASVVAVSSPADAASQTEAENLIKKAEKLAANYKNK